MSSSRDKSEAKPTDVPALLRSKRAPSNLGPDKRVAPSPRVAFFLGASYPAPAAAPRCRGLFFACAATALHLRTFAEISLNGLAT
jgi:hypothetical protein